MKQRLIPALCAAFALAPFAAVAAEMTTLDGVYTEAQAERGKQAFEQFCLSCHAVEFYEDKLEVWEGQPVSALYNSVSASMPQDNPGGLYLDEYTDIFAYIFSILDYPAGDQELDHTDDSMESIIIETK